MDTSLITVLMAVYNGADYVREAIDSVLAQTYTNFELLIVNDGSTDATLDIVKSYTDPRIRILTNDTNLGLIGSLNRGLAEARGRFIARLDHDDIALPDRLQTQLFFMQARPGLDVVGSWAECISQDGKHIKISRNPTEPIVIAYELLFNNVMFHSSIFFKKDTIIERGGYSPDYKHAEDYEMYSRIGKELVCANIPKVLLKYRLHEDSVTGSAETSPLVYATALNIVYRNLSSYAPLTRTQFDSIVDVLVIKKPSHTATFCSVLLALRTLKHVTRTFIERNVTSPHDQALIHAAYRGRRRMIWQHYILGKWQKIKI